MFETVYFTVTLSLYHNSLFKKKLFNFTLHNPKQRKYTVYSLMKEYCIFQRKWKKTRSDTFCQKHGPSFKIKQLSIFLNTPLVSNWKTHNVKNEIIHYIWNNKRCFTIDQTQSNLAEHQSTRTNLRHLKKNFTQFILSWLYRKIVTHYSQKKTVQLHITPVVFHQHFYHFPVEWHTIHHIKRKNFQEYPLPSMNQPCKQNIFHSN